MKKLIELFKSYEHVLSEDSVMDHFRNILNKVIMFLLLMHTFCKNDWLFFLYNLNWKQGKKFAKLELKACIEEFEDKLNKFHTDKKEQEVTARNAQIHQQKIGSREGFTVTINSEDHLSSNSSSG